MRKITKEAVNAFISGKSLNSGNTSVQHRDKMSFFYLHGNCIATLKNNELYISHCGCKSNDTKLHYIIKEINKIVKNTFYKFECTISTNGQNCHEYSMCINSNVEKVEDDFLYYSRQLAIWYYDNLEKEFSYLTSDEAILENFIANEYEFLSNGKIA